MAGLAGGTSSSAKSSVDQSGDYVTNLINKGDPSSVYARSMTPIYVIGGVVALFLIFKFASK